MDKFWMVLGSGVPSVRHSSIDSAEREAERLAKLNAGQQFFVLEAVKSVKAGDVEWTELDRRSGWRNVNPVLDKPGCAVVCCSAKPLHHPDIYLLSTLVGFYDDECKIKRLEQCVYDIVPAKHLWVYEDDDIPF